MKNIGLIETARAVAELGDDFTGLSDAELLGAQGAISMHQRTLDLVRAKCAGEIARRSSHELGYAGLARREGFVSAEAMVQSLTGSSKTDAGTMVRVGTLLTEQGPLAEALESGSVSADAVAAIDRGLGEADSSVDAESLATATQALIEEASSSTPDQLLRLARAERERLDADAVAARQKERRDQRYFWVKRCDDGMVRGSFAIADEDGAFLLEIFDRASGPRPVGPRFVPNAEVSLPSLDEPRTRGQKAADEIVSLLHIGVDADPNAMLGHDRPSVRIAVLETSLKARTGHGRIEGSPDPVTIQTIEQQLCGSGFVGVKFDDNGQCVNVGREQRLFNRRQRIGIALRDGGCRMPGCDRPVSWCEAHHVEHWKRDEGKTDIADGILLCRLHHLLLHNNQWEIERDGGEYWLVPPPSVDPLQRRRLMPSKEPLMRELLAAG